MQDIGVRGGGAIHLAWSHGAIDPQLLAKARELRDRYLEHVNGERVNGTGFVLEAAGKYDLHRLPNPGVAGADAVGVGLTPRLLAG